MHILPALSFGYPSELRGLLRSRLLKTACSETNLVLVLVLLLLLLLQRG